MVRMVGFNAGSSAASDLSTGQAFAVTQIAAAGTLVDDPRRSATQESDCT